ncbi:negative regulator of beta-lactamase expression [Idiomarina sp. A28L]|uniref:1,6-anhydro-N-acetylmuramyl-L-alanine amidase AmpD n=1 Tax=Idiomarina sp. A28L TaxID=1036674 RepID=UPI000213872A|nr:1,6-anhydro-N-acetylmuramyl-L-alanine amidase AmpD [Idiomarina sp. A28L]EGN74820.1 negative regulator of beta-lactamase expression [Idiomarina sp. A28L]
MLNLQAHRLTPVTWQCSPHADERPDSNDISLLVVHGISLPEGEFGGPYINDLFLGCLDCEAHPNFAILEGLRVSAHCLIRRNGEIIQYVDFNRRAWHAGVSSWQGRERCNDYSIGIELEGTDSTPYTKLQYEALAEVTRVLQQHYPAITNERIVGHEDIAPGRKTDPGPAFDWQTYRALISETAHK